MRRKTKDERKKEFLDLIEKALAPDDAEHLLHSLVARGFFKAPASGKYHGCYEGGLADHSIEVTKALLYYTENLGLKWKDPRSPYLVGLLHDVCKCDEYRITKDGVEYVKNLLLTGHGEKSVILAQQIVAGFNVEYPMLTEEELLCIRWHMGAFCDSNQWGNYSTACTKYPNVIFTHTADMYASKVKGI